MYGIVSILIYASVECVSVVFKGKCASFSSRPGSVRSYCPVVSCDGFVFQGELAQLLFKVAVVAFLWDGCKF